MNTLYFITPGRLDTRAITVFGLSAKPGENPIGFFGTGLKYAIAILMREGADIYIETAGMRYDFEVHDDTFRDKEFKCIGMHSALKGYELPFTTQLGKTWEMWQAYREIYCNTKDENGLVMERLVTVPETWDEYTVISITHPDFFSAHADRDKYFIHETRTPLSKGISMEVYHGETKHMFYRGIRVGDLERESIYTWNYTYSMDLTEDRTCKYGFIWSSPIPGIIANAKDDTFIRRCVTAPEGTMEGSLDYGISLLVSPEFMKVMSEYADDFSGAVNHTARKLYEHNAKQSIGLHSAVPISKVEQSMLDKAMQVCRDLGTKPDDATIIVTQSLGQGVLGLCTNGKIFLSKAVFNMGTKMVAGTLWEELLHLETHMFDCTRGMQNFLINMVITQYEEGKGEAL